MFLSITIERPLESVILRRGAVCFPFSNLPVVNGQGVISRTNRWIDGDYGGEKKNKGWHTLRDGGGRAAGSRCRWGDHYGHH